MFHRSRLPFLSLILASATFSARAATEEAVLPEFKIRHSTLTIVSENDKYFAGTDRHYTNGLKLAWIGETDLDQSYQFVRTVARVIPWMDATHEDWRYKVGFTLGQNQYTPADTDTSALVVNDRPYAGWLYGSLLLHAQKDNQLRLVEVTAGIVGPSAQGEFFQNAWHDVINVAHANGWDNQLRDEPGLQLSWERRYRVWTRPSLASGLPGADVILRHRVTLGNVATHAAAGFVVRAGWRLPDDFGPDLIRPGGGNTPDDKPRRFGAYFYASTEARAVARDIFLDGNTWKDSHSVDKREIVADLNLGFVLHWPSFRLAYTQNYRTKEFYGQLRRDVFGSLGLSFSR